MKEKLIINANLLRKESEFRTKSCLRISRNGSSFTIPYNRQELADFLVIARNGLSAEISKLRKENVIECKRNFFRLLKK